MLIPLPDGMELDIRHAVITADALRCQRGAAQYRHDHGAGFLLPVKDDQPGPSGALDALPGAGSPAARTATGRGHGRITTRTI